MLIRNVVMAAAIAFVPSFVADANAAGERDRTVILTSAQVSQVSVRQRVIAAPFVRPPVELASQLPLVSGPCLQERRSNWINGARVETRTGLCRWSDGTLRPTR